MCLNQFSTLCAWALVRYRRFRREAWTSFSQFCFSGGTNRSVRSIHYIVYRDGKGNETVIRGDPENENLLNWGYIKLEINVLIE